MISRKVMCVLLFAIAAFSVGMSRAARADIVGGEEVQAIDPIQSTTAALYEPSAGGRGGALCTASLIGKDIAVTAAHCVQPGGPKPVLLFGRDVHSPQTIKRQVTGVSVNPRWKTRAGKGMDEGDIALVRFPGGLPSGYQTVKPLDSEKSLKKGDTAVLAGYGISNARTHAGAGVLRKTSVKILNSRPGKSEMILDQSHGRGACHGDSGGPAYVRHGKGVALAGVTNRSYPARAPDDCAHQVVYTKVDAYRSWIQKEERKLRASPSPSAGYSAKAGSRAPRHSSSRASKPAKTPVRRISHGKVKRRH